MDDNNEPESGAAHLASPASYSTAHVAQRLGVSVPTVQRWVDAGHLKAWKTLGGHRRIDARSAERLFQSRHLPADDDAGAAATPSPGIVIVEDNPDDRELLAALCEEAVPGARVTLADNGFMGLVAIGQESPDIVVTDIVMPKMDGLEMLRQLARHPDVRPKLLIAASSRLPERLSPDAALPEGVVFVSKPIDPEPFVRLLRDALAR